MDPTAGRHVREILMEEVNEVDVNGGGLASESRTIPATSHQMLLAEYPALHTYRPPPTSTIQHGWQPPPSPSWDGEHPRQQPDLHFRPHYSPHYHPSFGGGEPPSSYGTESIYRCERTPIDARHPHFEAIDSNSDIPYPPHHAAAEHGVAYVYAPSQSPAHGSQPSPALHLGSVPEMMSGQPNLQPPYVQLSTGEPQTPGHPGYHREQPDDGRKQRSL